MEALVKLKYIEYLNNSNNQKKKVIVIIKYTDICMLEGVFCTKDLQ